MIYLISVQFLSKKLASLPQSCLKSWSHLIDQCLLTISLTFGPFDLFFFQIHAQPYPLSSAANQLPQTLSLLKLNLFAANNILSTSLSSFSIQCTLTLATHLHKHQQKHLWWFCSISCYMVSAFKIDKTWKLLNWKPHHHFLI